jgi:hypothetical protein
VLKFIFLLIFLCSFLFSTAQNCRHGQCLAITQKGYQCKRCVNEYSSYCWQHGGSRYEGYSNSYNGDYSMSLKAQQDYLKALAWIYFWPILLPREFEMSYSYRFRDPYHVWSPGNFLLRYTGKFIVCEYGVFEGAYAGIGLSLSDITLKLINYKGPYYKKRMSGYLIYGACIEDFSGDTKYYLKPEITFNLLKRVKLTASAMLDSNDDLYVTGGLIFYYRKKVK